jgi:LuxR family transcriptional regulator, maltose regulon positive regulatory protein
MTERRTVDVEPAAGGRSAAPAGLLVTKLHPPATREQTVPRQRLLDKLHPHPGTKLTLIAAPAGCGKSTLLAEWREHEMLRRPVAWLSVDEADDDPVVFWS